MLTSKSLRNTDKEIIQLSFQVCLNDVLLSQKTCVKYLGVLIDSNLNWSSHVQLVRTKLSRASHLLFKIREFAPIAVLKMLYYSFVYCHLQYCIMSWGTANNSVLQPLNILHNKILGIMTFSNYSCHVTPLYKSISYKGLRSGKKSNRD